MKREKFIQEMEKHGDALVTYRSAKSRKLKYNVCTMEFDNKYIQSKRNRARPNEHQVLTWCWDTDSFRLLVPENVVSVIPLSVILK